MLIWGSIQPHNFHIIYLLWLGILPQGFDSLIVQNMTWFVIGCILASFVHSECAFNILMFQLLVIQNNLGEYRQSGIIYIKLSNSKYQ